MKKCVKYNHAQTSQNKLNQIDNMFIDEIESLKKIENKRIRSIHISWCLGGKWIIEINGDGNWTMKGKSDSTLTEAVKDLQTKLLVKRLNHDS